MLCAKGLRKILEPEGATFYADLSDRQGEEL